MGIHIQAGHDPRAGDGCAPTAPFVAPEDEATGVVSGAVFGNPDETRSRSNRGGVWNQPAASR
jgi:hypothetical protein